MTDTVLFDVLQMPYSLAMKDTGSRIQYWQWGRQAADEIERLREVLTIMIPHIEHMVRNAEDAKQVDTDFIRNRLYDARAALGEGE